MQKVIRERYPPEDWNIYAAQASDGDNLNSDNAHCQYLLDEHILPHCQYFAYVEIWDRVEAEIFQDDKNTTRLWQAYDDVRSRHKNLAIRRVTRAGDVFPVMHDLFTQGATEDTA